MALEPEVLAHGVAVLAARDPDLRSLLEANGPPPLWAREPGFPAMVRFVLEQQVSLASADAAYRKLEAAIGRVTPRAFLSRTDDELRRIGFSRQKAGYCRGIAISIADGTLDLEAVAALDDEDARTELLKVRGVGPWTADCYLLFVMGRPDAWPSGDRALQVALAGVKKLVEVPDVAAADAIAQEWRPWRAIAARMLWHEYLGGQSYTE